MSRLTAKPVARLALLVLVSCASQASADWEPNPDLKGQVSAANAMQRMREKIPELNAYFEQAWGYAVVPGVTRVGLGFGGAYGKGIVIEQEELVGLTSFSQFTSGIQLGAKYFSMIIFFRDQEAIEEYKLSRMQFVGQAGIDLATVGASGTPSYNEGVAIFAMTRFGLMGEFTISGAWYKYRPLVQD